jgi:peptide deformylase
MHKPGENIEQDHSRWWKVCGTLAVGAFILFVLALLLSNVWHPPGQFRKSRQFALDELRGVGVEGSYVHYVHKKVLDAFNTPEFAKLQCGVIAPYVGEFVSYVVMNTNGVFKEYINPQIVSLEPTPGNIKVWEKSPLCRPSDTAIMTRAGKAVISYIDAQANKQEDVLRNGDALCMQHNIGVLNGWWPCMASRDEL